MGAFVATSGKLHAPDTRFDDSDSPRLVDLPNLTHLVISNTKITDKTLPHIGTLVNLETLDLSETSISDAIISVLPRLRRLRVLGLFATQITDFTLEAIASLPRLEALNISLNPQITSLGFNHLKRLEHLKSVEIHGTAISDVAVNKFSTQYSDVLIVTDSGVVRGIAE